ncbi:MAG: SDR family NAD(P)-dependent oxidoreductase, partial [Clostridia bacterium]|nr:SDR family NAD(P)-dependent oxidoreductase [Clostridia bacterium]
AVITGASSGMGREFALRIDGEESFDEIWLIARRTDRLEEIARVCKNPARAISMDLTKSEAWDEYKRMLESENADVRVLVNAAGFGKFKAFTELTLEEQLDMIDLNNKALVSMTYVTLPYMTGGASIYQIASRAAFQPVPYMNVYGASKAFVLSFSRALNKELQKQKRGIRCLAVCPGWVSTEFLDRAEDRDTIIHYDRIYTAQQVVSRSFHDMKWHKDVSVCGLSSRMKVFATKHLPHGIVMELWCWQQKK